MTGARLGGGGVGGIPIPGEEGAWALWGRGRVGGVGKAGNLWAHSSLSFSRDRVRGLILLTFWFLSSRITFCEN